MEIFWCFVQIHELLLVEELLEIDNESVNSQTSNILCSGSSLAVVDYLSIHSMQYRAVKAGVQFKGEPERAPY